ncbi:MAG TPA: phage portal protein [Gemmataceae bacterium]|nr:phage portal protein [Gemmataceae bacterium]
MRTFLAKTLFRLAHWLQSKGMPYALAGSQWSGTSFVDSYKRNRQPTPNEILAELKNTAWTCASINAATCANYPPRLYVITEHNQPRPKCLTKSLSQQSERRLRSLPHLHIRAKSAAIIEEVTDHPLLTLLQRANVAHNAFDLWELTTLYQEVHGSAYWGLDVDPMLGVPRTIWILPTQNVTPRRDPNSANLVDYYLYRNGTSEERFAPNRVIHFAYPDPRDPYTSGLSPLRACFEQVALTSEYAAFKKAKFENHAIPDAIISPDEVMGEEERDRLETQWNHRFRRGGSGKVVVAESSLKVSLLNQSMGDVAALADMAATKNDIANAFHIPIAFLTSQTNLANLQASRSQHMSLAIGPRLQRRDEKLNAQLVPLFDPTGRLFLASEDPVPVDQNLLVQQQIADLKYGVVSINEIRSERGLPPVPWGEVPWLPLRWARTNRRENPKSEIRKKSEIRITKDKNKIGFGLSFSFWSLRFLSDFGFRISSLEIQSCPIFSPPTMARSKVRSVSPCPTAPPTRSIRCSNRCRTRRNTNIVISSRPRRPRRSIPANAAMSVGLAAKVPTAPAKLSSPRA